MNSITIIAVAMLIGCSSARVYLDSPIVLAGFEDEDPEFYKAPVRHTRDLTWDTKAGNGKVFGTLGNNNMGLFGKGGYKQDIFNDDRGHLQGEAYGSRVLSPYGDSSHLGGRLDYANENANAALDISRQIGGRTSLQAEGNGVWKLDKDTDLSAGAILRQEHLGHGRPDVGFQGKYEHRF